MVAAAALIVEDDLEVVCRVVRQTSRRVVERLRLEVGDDRALAVSDRATPPVGGEVAWVRAVIKGHIPAVSLRVHRPGQVRTAARNGTRRFSRNAR